MESSQSVHGRITYRRVETVINDKIASLDYASTRLPFNSDSRKKLEYAIETLESVRNELRWRDATHYWPSPR